MAHALAAHAAERQSQIARNVANADTPGYKAQDLSPFADTLDASSATAMRATRAGHLHGQGDASAAAIRERPGEASPNGNTVSVENEMMQAARVRQSHDMALSIYSSARGIMSAALGKAR